MLLGLIAALMVVAAAPTADRTHTLRYDLPIGMSYEYRVATDQIPFPNKVVRLHTKLVLDVVGRDENDNTVCRFSVTADTNYEHTDDVSTRQYGYVEFAGHRLYSKAGYVEIILDAHGNIASNDPDDTTNRSSNAVSTQFRKLASASMMAAVSGNSPYMLQLLMPSMPEASDLEIEREYSDTLTFPSRSVYVPTSYGTTNTVEHKVLYDTLYRVSILDSVRTVGDQSFGYMTLTNERRNALGGAYSSESRLVRDMRTGLVQKITETCYKYTMRGERKLTYRSTANLVTQAPMSALQLRQEPRTGVR